MIYIKTPLFCILLTIITLFNSCSGSDDSTSSNSVIISEPLNFSATAINANSITLKWEKPSTNADLVAFYVLERDDGGLIPPVDKDTFTFIDTKLTPDTSYTYSIHAEGANDNKGTVATTTVKTKVQGTYTGKLNGVDYTFKLITAKKINSFNPVILIETEGENGFGDFHFSIATEVKANTTYSCDETINTADCFLFFTIKYYKGSLEYIEEIRSVTITEYSDENKNIKGTFTLQLVNTDDPMDKVSFTNGMFDVTWIE